MPKPLPDDTWENLFYPPPDYRYFEDCAQHDFEPDADGFSWVNAWWLADAALLAYVKDWEAVEGHLGAAGLDKDFTRIGDDPTKSTKGYFVSRSGQKPFAVLAFRGTDKDDLRNVISDLDTAPESLGRYIVHKGFARALDQVWDEVTRALDTFVAAHPGAPIYFTGHSLGAALATLSVARFTGAKCALYTIGSPRVGDDRFVRAVLDKTQLVFRFVNCQDIVTLVPPEIALAHYFRHVGNEMYIDRHGVLHDHPSELVKAADVVPGVLDHDGGAVFEEIKKPLDFLTLCFKGSPVNPPPFLIGNHTPSRYAIRIWNYYTRA
jgi:hypothetical protein